MPLAIAKPGGPQTISIVPPSVEGALGQPSDYALCTYVRSGEKPRNCRRRPQFWNARQRVAAPAGAAARRLEFPTELSKLERARWHSLAHRKGLPTESCGVGDDRFLSIASQQPAEEAAGADKPLLNRAQRHRAQQVYDFCQLEGGRFWDYSKGELEDLVASGQPWPQDLRDMVERR
jgi:hypothetical protein